MASEECRSSNVLPRPFPRPGTLLHPACTSPLVPSSTPSQSHRALHPLHQVPVPVSGAPGRAQRRQRKRAHSRLVCGIINYCVIPPPTDSSVYTCSLGYPYSSQEYVIEVCTTVHGCMHEFRGCIQPQNLDGAGRGFGDAQAGMAASSVDGASISSWRDDQGDVSDVSDDLYPAARSPLTPFPGETDVQSLMKSTPVDTRPPKAQPKAEAPLARHPLDSHPLDSHPDESHAADVLQQLQTLQVHALSLSPPPGSIRRWSAVVVLHTVLSVIPWRGVSPLMPSLYLHSPRFQEQARQQILTAHNNRWPPPHIVQEEELQQILC
jgi:hypothetical protein